MMDTFMNPNRFKERVVRFRGLTIVLVSTIIGMVSYWGVLFVLGYVGDSAARIQREHGLRLPPSARNFVCRGDAWMHNFMDSGAASAFEMAPSDLPSFVSQLKIHEVHPGDCSGPCIIASNPQYQIRRPWMSAPPLKTYCCASPTGDYLAVQIWIIDDTHVGVFLYTDWN
jgi:hypothetical protein